MNSNETFISKFNEEGIEKKHCSKAFSLCNIIMTGLGFELFIAIFYFLVSKNA